MVLRATCLFFGRHYLNFGQHDSGFRRHDFGRDDSRATWSISFRAFHLTFPVDEVIWTRSPSTLIPRVISPSYSSHDHAVVCHEYDMLPAHDQRTVLKKSCVRCWWVSKCVLWYIIKTGEEQGQFPSRSPEWLTTNNRIFVGHAVHTVIWDRFHATFNVNVKTDVLFR